VNNRGANNYGQPPAQVSFGYQAGGQSGFGQFDNVAPNPGKPWHAGHLLANQNGGLGNNPDWVIPQNPSENCGGVWRAGEQGFHNAVQSSGQTGNWSVTTHQQPRPTYKDDPSLNPNAYFGRWGQ
jgi:hypothetical protein